MCIGRPLKLGESEKTYCYEPMYGGGSRGRGYVCMYVRGGRESRQRSNGSGTGRREREAYRSEADGMLTFQEIVSAACPATGSEGRESREKRVGAQ